MSKNTAESLAKNGTITVVLVIPKGSDAANIEMIRIFHFLSNYYETFLFVQTSLDKFEKIADYCVRTTGVQVDCSRPFMSIVHRSMIIHEANVIESHEVEQVLLDGVEGIKNVWDVDLLKAEGESACPFVGASKSAGGGCPFIFKKNEANDKQQLKSGGCPFSANNDLMNQDSQNKCPFQEVPSTPKENEFIKVPEIINSKSEAADNEIEIREINVSTDKKQNEKIEIHEPDQKPAEIVISTIDADNEMTFYDISAKHQKEIEKFERIGNFAAGLCLCVVAIGIGYFSQ